MDTSVTILPLDLFSKKPQLWLLVGKYNYIQVWTET